jgi:hypothetical protein
MAYDDDDARDVSVWVGQVRGMPDLRAIPAIEDGDEPQKGSFYFPNATEAPGVVRAGPCVQCRSPYYHPVISSDGVSLLQCESCGQVYRRP